MYSLTGIGTDGRPWVNLFYDFGGIGARHGVDGPDATGCYFLGGRSVIPQIEPLEAQYPFVVRRSRLLPDSGGAGQWRGGLGTEIVVELLGDAELTVRGDRIELPPPGVDGGGAGAAGVYAVERADGTTEVLPDEAGRHPASPPATASSCARRAAAVSGHRSSARRRRARRRDRRARRARAARGHGVDATRRARRRPTLDESERVQRRASESASWFVGVDVGGTFTDVVLADADGDLHVDKVPTTPDDPRVGVIEGIRHVLQRSRASRRVTCRGSCTARRSRPT